jgi:hypothetical protein
MPAPVIPVLKIPVPELPVEDRSNALRMANSFTL